MKRGVLIAKRWGCEPRTAARFEYQVRRTALKSMGVDDFSSYLERRCAIAEYLFGKWFRVIDGDFPSDHPNQEPVDAFWMVIEEAFRDWCGGAAEPVMRTRTVRPNAFRMFRGAIGYLVSGVATESGGELYTSEEVKQIAIERLSLMMENLDMEGLYEKALCRFTVEYPKWAFQ